MARLLPDQVPNTYYGVEWANDNRTIFYNVLDTAMRPYKLYRHTLGADPREDLQVYHEPAEAFFLYALLLDVLGVNTVGA